MSVWGRAVDYIYGDWVAVMSAKTAAAEAAYRCLMVTCTYWPRELAAWRSCRDSHRTCRCSTVVASPTARRCPRLLPTAAHRSQRTQRIRQSDCLLKGSCTVQKIVIDIVTEFFYSAPQCSHCTSYSNSVRPSVHLSVCPSGTRRYCVKTTACSTEQSALSDSKMCLVF